MGKVVIILVVCAVGGYAYKKGYFARWVEQAQEGVATTIEPATPPQWEERARPPQEQFQQTQPRPLASSGPSMTENCARARQNVREMESWMRQGGTVVEVKGNKRLSENQTFDALAKNRQFIEENCR